MKQRKVNMSDDAHQRMKAELRNKHMCYVLITCDQPTEDGNMQVEMTYEGDAVVASYLIQGAQNFIEEQSHDQVITPKKIHPLNQA